MSELTAFNCEIQTGFGWLGLNDHLNYTVNGDQTRNNSSKQFRQVTAQSPVLGGTYLIHSVPDMTSETVTVYISGGDMVELHQNKITLDNAFEQLNFQMRWTFNDVQEIWSCTQAQGTYVQNAQWMHNRIIVATYQVPRLPNTTYVRTS